VTLFIVFAVPIVALAVRSSAGLAPVRWWTTLGLRLAVVATLVLILGGARWTQRIKDLEVVVVRDESASTGLVQNLPERTLDASVDAWLRETTTGDAKPPDDRIGLIRFARNARIQSMPARRLFTGAAAISDPAARDATDVAGALRLATSTFSGEALHRLVLLWDGNMTTGGLDAALAAAAARHIPVDVMPLEYRIGREVIVERLDAPAIKREGEPFSVRVALRSTDPGPVRGRVSLRDRGRSLDMDPGTPGLQTSRAVTLAPGVNVVTVQVGATESGVRDLEAAFEPEDASDDTLAENNAARAFTFVRGRGSVLYVDNVPDDGGKALADALGRERIGVRTDRLAARDFPRSLAERQSYDAVILANVPRGMGGLDAGQERALASYVHDLGGGLVMIGGPDGFGAGGWTGSKLEEVLPVDCSIPAKRVLPAGLLVLVLDHSGSMGERVGGSKVTKQQAANQSAVLAMKTLSRQDWVGVVSFDSQAQWTLPVRQNDDPSAAIDAINGISPGGGTMIPAGLELACEALERLGPEKVAVKHVLLLTDGQSRGGGYDELVGRLRKAGASLSTVGVGDDVNPKLLYDLAEKGGGRYYPVADPNQLPQIFVKEARTIRRRLILERPFTPLRTGVGSPLVGGLSALPPLRGLVLTSPKASPNVSVPLVSPDGDPVLAHWQAGLGRVAVFTSDASGLWAPAWISSEIYDKFWAQTLRWVLRPPISGDFEVTVSKPDPSGRAKVTLLASQKSGESLDFLSFGGKVVGPDLTMRELRLGQTGPGRYEGSFEVGVDGNYVGLLHYRGPGGRAGTLPVGTSVEASPELRVLSSDNAAILRVVNRTGGRILRPWDPAAARLFTREGLTPEATSLPAWDHLMMLMIGLLLLDVAARRLAWSREDVARVTAATGAWIRSFTTVPKPDTRPTLESLRQVREQTTARQAGASHIPPPSPDRGARSAAAPVAAPPPVARPAPRPASDPDDQATGLKAAKLRARKRFDR
jgi:Mg-chelatase subunit ChlD